MSEDLVALVRLFDSPDRDRRLAAINDAYTYVCHQAQTVYPETLETVEPLASLAVDADSPGRSDALKLLADMAGSTNSDPRDYEAVRAAVRERLPNIMASVAAHPTPATAVALAQLAWSYPSDSSVNGDILTALLQQFDDAAVLLALALALQAHNEPFAASFAFHAAFAEAQEETDTQRPSRWTTTLRALGLRSAHPHN
jgi:hypothetical protein